MHTPVLLHESINVLEIKQGGTYVDCTTNRGGHSIEIAERLGKKGKLICLDLDSDALKEAEEKLKALPNHPKLYFICTNFRYVRKILDEIHIDKIDGLIADLGLSSQELENSGRGFTFQKDEPLQMTYEVSPNKKIVNACDIVNLWDEKTIADILYGFADEKYSRKIAKSIVEYRKVKPIKTTFELVEIIKNSVPKAYGKRKIHLATKTFQALRIAVNDELGSLHELILSLVGVLKKNGRACIITFHSTEDRIVKQEFRNYKSLLRPVTKKPIKPKIDEVKENPRSRSALLRIVEKI